MVEIASLYLLLTFWRILHIHYSTTKWYNKYRTFIAMNYNSSKEEIMT